MKIRDYSAANKREQKKRNAEILVMGRLTSHLKD